MEKELDALSIFALRELARRTGVSSPTSKKKNELIKDIIAINAGVKKPHIAKTKQGRPPKGFGYDFSNILNAKNTLVPTFSKTITLNQESEEFQSEQSDSVVGILEVLPNSVGYLWNYDSQYNCYFVPANILNKYELKSGDKLFAVLENENDEIFVKDVLNVNGFPILKFEKNRKNFFSIEHVSIKENFMFNKSEYNNLQIKKGENTYIYGEDNNENTDVVVDLLNSINCKNKLYINVSIVEKNKHFLTKLKDVELFVSKLTDNLDTSKRIVNLAQERAKRILENGEDVVLVVDDVLSVSGIDNPELPILKSLISITKKANNGSVSIIALMDNRKLVYSLEKLADNKLKIENSMLIK